MRGSLVRPGRLVSRLLAVLLAVTSIGTAACGSPLASEGALAGDWRTGPIPSGGSIAVTLSTAGASVTGSGESRAVGPNGAISLLTVTGSQSDHHFLLTFTFDSGIVATYAGSFVGSSELAGPWSVAGQPSGFLTLYRQ